MPRLFLLRHAKSPPALPGQGDFDRPLGERGRAAAAAVGRFLAAGGHMPNRVLCSPAARTRETLEGIQPFLADAPSVEFVRELYEASLGTMLRVITAHAGTAEQVLVVGHNPSIHRLASTLPGAGDRGQMARLNAKFPTAALAVVEFSGDWADVRPGEGRLIAYVTPADLGEPAGD